MANEHFFITTDFYFEDVIAPVYMIVLGLSLTKLTSDIVNSFRNNVHRSGYWVYYAICAVIFLLILQYGELLFDVKCFPTWGIFAMFIMLINPILIYMLVSILDIHNVNFGMVKASDKDKYFKVKKSIYSVLILLGIWNIFTSSYFFNNLIDDSKYRIYIANHTEYAILLIIVSTALLVTKNRIHETIFAFAFALYLVYGAQNFTQIGTSYTCEIIGVNN